VHLSLCDFPHLGEYLSERRAHGDTPQGHPGDLLASCLLSPARCADLRGNPTAEMGHVSDDRHDPRGMSDADIEAMQRQMKRDAMRQQGEL